MLPFAYYILKVIICSSVLYGYYWFFLRNKIFHSYNRFYLLATIALSLTLPLLKFNVWQKADAPKTSVVQMLQVVSSSDEYMDEIIIQSHYNHISKEAIAMWIFISICFVFALIFMISIFKIYSLKKNNPLQRYEDISLVHTEDKRTPFSFLKNIFWNDEIDINSENGKRILKHELTHVKEKHSHDKLFMNVVLIFFWCNPIFWLLRKELNMIHEFIADKKAVQDGDTAAFAAMILQATYPGHRFELANNFFYSPIKRRLTMLTKNKTKVSYISRLLVLPLTVIVFAAFTLKAKTYIASFPTGKTITVLIDAGHGGTDNGAIAADGTMEKDLTLSLAKKIQELNHSENIKILLTRETDIYQDPREKGGFPNKLGADLFITIHIDNEAKDAITKQTGLTAWVARDEFKNAATSKLLASSITSVFKDNYPLRVAENANQREKGILVLQEASCPSVLIEAGFISNNKDLIYLKSADGKEQFARNVLNAIISYENTFGDNKINNVVNPQAPLKTVSKNTDATDINIGYNVPKGSVSVHAGKKTLQENVDYTINYNLGKIKIINKGILDAAIPVEVNFNNTIKSAPDTNPDFKPIVQKIQNDMFVDASQVVSIKNETENFYAITKLDRNKKDIQPLIVINGIESTRKKLNEIDPGDLQYIRVLKPETALVIYGDKGKQGALIINTKPATAGHSPNKSDLSSADFSVGNISGTRVSFEEFKKQKTISVPAGFTFISATVYFSGKGFEDKLVITGIIKDLSSLQEYMEKCVPGTVVTFDDIKIQTEKGNILFIESKSYQLFDDKEIISPKQKLPAISLSGISTPFINIKNVPELKELKYSDEHYKIVSAIVYFSGNGFQNPVMTFLNDGSLKNLDANMNKIVTGSALTFDNIYISKIDGSDKKEIDGKSFRFYDKFINEVDPDTLPNKVFTKVEQEPEFPGGKDAWQAYLQKNLNPATPVDEGWKPGTYKIVVNFVVDKEGNVSDVSSDDYINSKTAQQCINLIKNGPKWVPAKQNGKIVSAYRKQPITFVVSEN
ncbi:MAG: N-acetylmuramoyl-L-alanine amidase [Ferruginibacter sp.]